MASFLDPRFCMRRELFSDTEWNETKNLILELVEEGAVTEEIEVETSSVCGNEVQWWSLQDTADESIVSVSKSKNVSYFYLSL